MKWGEVAVVNSELHFPHSKFAGGATLIFEVELLTIERRDVEDREL